MEVNKEKEEMDCVFVKEKGGNGLCSVKGKKKRTKVKWMNVVYSAWRLYPPVAAEAGS